MWRAGLLNVWWSEQIFGQQSPNEAVSVVFQFEGAGCVGLLQNAVLLRSALEQLPSTALVTLGAV